GVRAGAVEDDVLIGPLGAHVAPGRHVGVGTPDAVELVGRHALGPVVLDVDDDREAISGNGQLDERDTVQLAQLYLAGLDDAAGAGDVRLAPAELLEAGAGAGKGYGHARARAVDQELLGEGQADGVDGGRAVHSDVLGEGASRGQQQYKCDPLHASSTSERKAKSGLSWHCHADTQLTCKRSLA